MKLDLVFKDVRPSDELVERLEAKFDKIEKLLNRALAIHVSLMKSKTAYRCVARFVHRGKEFIAEGRAEDIFAASDSAFHKLEVQVTKSQQKSVTKRTAAKVRGEDTLLA